MSAECPTCQGSGRVPQHIAAALNGQSTRWTAGDSCWCDGPQHPYDPVRWCPKSGPTKGRNR